MTRIGLTRTLASLNDEWSHLESRPIDASWRAVIPGPDTLAGVLAAIPRQPDAVLLALLRLLHAGDHLAGRVVVQTMLPKLVRMAVRDEQGCFDDYLAALWERAATYPLQRRPRRVAANLALDTLKSVTASRPRAVRALPEVFIPDPLSDALSVLDAGVRLGVIDGLTRRTLEAVYVEGRTSRAAGAVLGVSADSVRWRCSQGVRALRSVAPELTELVAG